MNRFEKLFVILYFALCLVFAVVAMCFFRPMDPAGALLWIERILPYQIIAGIMGIAFLFIIVRDILRRFTDTDKRLMWILLILFFSPSALYYLPIHAFKPRPPMAESTGSSMPVYVAIAVAVLYALFGMASFFTGYPQLKAMFAVTAEHSAEGRRRNADLKQIRASSIAKIRVYPSYDEELLMVVSNQGALAEFATSCRDLEDFFWNAPDIDTIKAWDVCVDGTNGPNQHEFKAYFVEQPTETLIGWVQESHGSGRGYRCYGHFASRQMYEWVKKHVADREEAAKEAKKRAPEINNVPMVVGAFCIDGKRDDWADVAPVTEEVGKHGTKFKDGIDVKQMYFAEDDTHVFLFFTSVPAVRELHEVRSANGRFCEIYLDTDDSVATGSKNYDMGYYRGGGVSGFDLCLAITTWPGRRGKSPEHTPYVTLRAPAEHGHFSENRFEQDGSVVGTLIADGEDGLELAVPKESLSLVPGVQPRALVKENGNWQRKEGYMEWTMPCKWAQGGSEDPP